MPLSIRNKRVLRNYSHRSFVFAHIIQQFSRHQDRRDSSRRFDIWSDAVESIVTTPRENLYPAITTRKEDRKAMSRGKDR